MKVHEAAVAVLRESKNPAVMWGDSGLLHMIADRANMRAKQRSWQTETAVLNALSRNHGELIPSKTTVRHGGQERQVRIFYLPEHKPKWMR